MNEIDRISELERKVDLMEKAMKILSKWMNSIDEVNEGDGLIFDNFNIRLKKLEVKK